MHIDPCFEDTSETTILKNVGGSSKLTRKGENALKNEPIAVEDNSSLANCETVLHNTLIRKKSSSIHIPAILMMIGMQRDIPYRSLTQTLSYKDVVFLIILDLHEKIEKGVDFCSRYKWLKHFSSVELWALLFLICYLLELINQNIGCRRQDALTTQVELIVEESNHDWFYEKNEASQVPNIFWNNSIKRLQGCQDIGFKNLESVRKGKIRNGNGLPPSWRSYTERLKTYRSEQKNFVFFRMNERMQTIPEETIKVEMKETEFGNETHICQETIDYSQKRKNAPAEIVGNVFSNKPGNTFSRNINNLIFSFMAITENNSDQKLILVQSSFFYKQSEILGHFRIQFLNLALSSEFKRHDVDFLSIFGDQKICMKWIFHKYERSKHLFPVESEALLHDHFIINLIKLVGWQGHDYLISEVECELKHIAEISKGASSYDLHVEERKLKILRRIGIKRLYESQDISFHNLELVRQEKKEEEYWIGTISDKLNGALNAFILKQNESVRFEKALDKMQIPEETETFEAKETAFGNETNICQEKVIILKNEKTRLPKSSVFSQINQETLPQEI